MMSKMAAKMKLRSRGRTVAMDTEIKEEIVDEPNVPSPVPYPLIKKKGSGSSQNKKKISDLHCDTCNEKFISLKGLKTHIIDNHTKYFYCFYCKTISKGKVELDSHIMSVHVRSLVRNNTVVFQCIFCKFMAYCFKKSVLHHMRQLHEKVMLPADRINKNKKLKNVTKHSLDKVDDKKLDEVQYLICFYCKVVHTSDSEVVNHIFLKHITILNENTYVCQLCNHSSDSKESSLLHVIKTHSEVKLPGKKIVQTATVSNSNQNFKEINLNNTEESFELIIKNKSVITNVMKSCDTLKLHQNCNKDLENEPSCSSNNLNKIETKEDEKQDCIYIYICPFCKKDFDKSEISLKEHIKYKHTLEYKNWITFWGKNAKHICKLKKVDLCTNCQNIKENSKIINSRLTNRTLCACSTILENEIYMCRICKTLFKQSDYVRHMIDVHPSQDIIFDINDIIHMEKLYFCDICKCILKLDEYVHHISNLHESHFCKKCDKIFMYQEYIDHIIEEHKSEKKEIITKLVKGDYCKLCKLDIEEIYTLANHIKNEHKELIYYRCNRCKATIKNEFFLTAHVCKSTTFNCIGCSIKFEFIHEFKQHIRIYHRSNSKLSDKILQNLIAKSINSAKHTHVSNLSIENIPGTVNTNDISLVSCTNDTNLECMDHQIIKSERSDEIDIDYPDDDYTNTHDDTDTPKVTNPSCEPEKSNILKIIKTENENTLNEVCQFVDNKNNMSRDGADDLNIKDYENMDTNWIKTETITFDNDITINTNENETVTYDAVDIPIDTIKSETVTFDTDDITINTSENETVTFDTDDITINTSENETVTFDTEDITINTIKSETVTFDTDDIPINTMKNETVTFDNGDVTISRSKNETVTYDIVDIPINTMKNETVTLFDTDDIPISRSKNETVMYDTVDIPINTMKNETVIYDNGDVTISRSKNETLTIDHGNIPINRSGHETVTLDSDDDISINNTQNEENILPFEFINTEEITFDSEGHLY